jgi:hypothetical protein
VAKPLYDLLKKNASYDWKEPQQNAFRTLKELLTTAPILQFPDFSRPFIIITDASRDAAGCILSQGEIGRDLPIVFASRTFNKAERNYSTTDREMAAIVWAVKQFRPYVLGRHFSIVTDHKPLKWVFNVKDPSSRLLRWRLNLEEYDFTTYYRSAKSISHADFLFCIHKADRKESGKKCEECVGHQQGDRASDEGVSPDVRQQAEGASDEKNGTTPSKESENESELSEPEKLKIIKEYHESLIGGHTGISRTYERLKSYISWPNMRKDIENYIRQCVSCQKNKHTFPTARWQWKLQTPHTSLLKKLVWIAWVRCR